MFTRLCLIVIVLTAITTPGLGLILSEVNYPAWTFTMKIWPFDILYPFETGFAILNGESMTTESEIRERMELARSEGANVVLFFRHEVIRDYLGEMAETARANGMVPFFESSSCDGMSGTYLGNDVSFTISGGIACSPEIEPEGDFRGAFRMSKATRDANQTFPMWFLGWPQNSENARREFAVNLCHSGNYYPTADAQEFYPENAFAFLDLLREPVLVKRQPVQNTVLIYPMRSKDYTFQSETTFMSYVSAFTTLAEKHIPFRILPLETMRMDDLTGIDHVVLAGAVSISDNEFDLIKDKMVYLIGTNGTLDEWGITRNEQIRFPDVVDISSLTPNLPFSILAPPETYIEYYIDNSDSNHYFIFTYNDIITGEIIISCSSPMTGNVYELDKIPRSISGSTLSIQIGDFLEVIEIRLSRTSSIERSNRYHSIVPGQNLCLQNIPNPFNASTMIHFVLHHSEYVSLKIFNLHGQMMKTLVNGRLSPGRYEIPFSDNNLSSGIYLMRLEAGNGSFRRRMIVLR